MIIKFTNARLAFPALFEAKTVGNDASAKPMFSAAFIFEEGQDCRAQIGTPSDTGGLNWEKPGPAVQIIESAIKRVADDKWKSQAGAIISGLAKKDRLCLHDGDTKAQYAGFPGNRFVQASNKGRPVVVDKDRSPLTSGDGKPYGGCYVNGTIDIWAQDNQYGKRVNATLTGVQFVKDGEAFGGGRRGSADDFDDLSDLDDGNDDLF